MVENDPDDLVVQAASKQMISLAILLGSTFEHFLAGMVVDDFDVTPVFVNHRLCFVITFLLVEACRPSHA